MRLAAILFLLLIAVAFAVRAPIALISPARQLLVLDAQQAVSYFIISASGQHGVFFEATNASISRRRIYCSVFSKTNTRLVDALMLSSEVSTQAYDDSYPSSINRNYDSNGEPSIRVVFRRSHDNGTTLAVMIGARAGTGAAMFEQQLKKTVGFEERPQLLLISLTKYAVTFINSSQALSVLLVNQNGAVNSGPLPVSPQNPVTVQGAPYQLDSDASATSIQASIISFVWKTENATSRYLVAAQCGTAQRLHLLPLHLSLFAVLMKLPVGQPVSG